MCGLVFLHLRLDLRDGPFGDILGDEEVVQRLLALIVGVRQRNALLLAVGLEHEVRVVARNVVDMTVIKLNPARLLDKLLNLRVLV